MSRSVAFLHTVPFLVETFSKLAIEHLPGVNTFHVVDGAILQQCFSDGVHSPKVLRRVLQQCTLAVEAGAEIVVFTCSSTSPAVDLVRPFCEEQIMKVDEPMAERAVEIGTKIGIVTTAETTLGPSADLIKSIAERYGKSVMVDARLESDAFRARVRGLMAEHDAIIRKVCAELAMDNDVLVLAQASMAHLAPSLQEEVNRPVLASPGLCMDALKRLLG